MKERTKSVLVRGAGTAFIVRLLGTGLVFVLQIVLARLLGSRDYGDYIYSLTLVSLLLLAGKIGMDSASLRFIPTYYGRGEWNLLRGYIRASRSISLASSTVIVLIGTLLVLAFHGSIRFDLISVLAIASLLLPTNALMQISGCALQALKHILLARSPQTILLPLIFLSLISVCRVLDISITASRAMSLNLLASLSVLLLMLGLVRNILPQDLSRFRPEYRIKEWMSVAFPLFVMGMFNIVLSNIGIVLVGSILGTEEAGIYAAANRIALLLLFGLEAVNAITAPMIAELYFQSRVREVQDLVSVAALAIFISVIPLGVVVIIVGKSVLALFGSAFIEGYRTLTILALGQIINALTGSVGYLMSMTGHQKEAAIVVGTCALLNLILSLLLIPKMGIEGAASSTAVSIALCNLIMLKFVYNRVGVNPTVFSMCRRMVRSA